MIMGNQLNENEIEIVMSTLNDEDKAEIINFYGRDIREAPDSEKKKRWNDFKKKILKLGKRYDFSGDRCTNYIIRIILRLPLSYYKNEWKDLEGIIGVVSHDLFYIYHKFASTDTNDGVTYLSNEVWNQPDLAIRILNKITPDEIRRDGFTIRKLEDILSRSLEENPEMSQNPDYQKLKDLWTKFK